MSNPPRPRQRLIEPGGLAQQLRTARGDLLAKDMADRAGWQISKISKIEHGKQLPSEDDLDTWARITGAGDVALHEWRSLLTAATEDRRSYASQTRAGQRLLQRRYNEIIAEATTFRLFEPDFIPRFLQTPDYTRAVLTESRERHGGADDIEASTAERQASLAYLFDPARSFEIIVTEATLGWCFAALPRDAHRAQLVRLLDAVDGPAQLRFGIIPLFQPIGWTPQNTFQILGEIGFMEHWIGELQFLLAEDIDRLNRVMDKLWESAREGDQAREIIRRAIERLDHADD
jgi:transcriptional regulator with XRE-family HTH domain